MNQNTKSLNRFPKSLAAPCYFVPNNYAESVCQNIALTLGEKDMRYILAQLYKFRGNPYPLEVVFSTVKDQIRLRKAKNPRALFNFLVSKALTEKGKNTI